MAVIENNTAHGTYMCFSQLNLILLSYLILVSFVYLVFQMFQSMYSLKRRPKLEGVRSDYLQALAAVFINLAVKWINFVPCS
jgi:hypothetical protein